MQAKFWRWTIKKLSKDIDISKSTKKTADLRRWHCCYVLCPHLAYFNPFLDNFLILYPLQTPENHWKRQKALLFWRVLRVQKQFSGVYKGIHFSTIFHFYSIWKHKKISWSSGFVRGYEMRTFSRNGLIAFSVHSLLWYTKFIERRCLSSFPWFDMLRILYDNATYTTDNPWQVKR